MQITLDFTEHESVLRKLQYVSEEYDVSAYVMRLLIVLVDGEVIRHNVKKVLSGSGEEE
jgi:hypothetical protein